MAKLIFSNIIGSFVFNENFRLIDGLLFKDLERYKDKKQYEEKLLGKHNDLRKPEDKELENILAFFKNKRYFSEFYKKNLELTKNSIKDSVNDDLLIIQTISSMGEIDKTVNLISKRLREWYSLYNPEISYKIKDHEKFVVLIVKKTKNQLLKEFNMSDTMGADLKEKDVSAIMLMAAELNNLYKLKNHYENYLEELEKKTCPNTAAVAGIAITAKLISHTGTLKRLARMPASTIQVIGAEKALFRHMRNKKRNLPPRHGLIMQHPLISEAPDKERGKRARALAAKISMAVKSDYFKGKFIGDKLKKELEERFRK